MAIKAPHLSAGYSGMVSDFIREMILGGSITPAHLLSWHQDLSGYFKSQRPTYVARKWLKEVRANHRVWELDGECDLVFSDNTPAIWSYVRAVSGEAAGLSKAIQDRTLPLYLALREDERKVSNWPKNKSPELSKIYSLKMKHCHILPCNDRSETVQSRKVLEERSFRLLSPLNHFLWPSPRHHFMSIGNSEKAVCYDLGEHPKVIEWIRWIYHHEFLSELGKDIEGAWRDLGGGASVLAKAPEDFWIDIYPKAMAHKIERRAELNQFSSIAKESTPPNPSRQVTMDEDRDLVEALPVDFPSSRANSVNTLNETDGYYSKAIMSEKLNAPYVQELWWRLNKNTTPRLVGKFRLNLRRLIEEGYVSSTANGIRMKIFHDSDGFSIRMNQTGPRVLIALPVEDEWFFE